MAGSPIKRAKRAAQAKQAAIAQRDRLIWERAEFIATKQYPKPGAYEAMLNPPKRDASWMGWDAFDERMRRLDT